MCNGQWERAIRARYWLPVVLLLAVPAAAEARESFALSSGEGLFLGKRYRWAEMNVLDRVVRDVVAIPGNVGRWDAGDWAQLALWSGAIGGLMFAGDPSPDVRINRWSTVHVDGRLPTLWTVPNEAVLWSAIAAGGLGTWWWAAANDRADIAQGVSLMAEALAVSQVYHLLFKFALGREGPTDGEGNAEILGPANALRVYPSGTPSGHASTLFSLLSAGFAYFRPPAWAQAIGYLLVGTVIAFHVIEHQHFLSDSLWGSAMGWYVGRWVVRNRASWLFGELGGAQVNLTPIGAAQAKGLAVRISF